MLCGSAFLLLADCCNFVAKVGQGGEIRAVPFTEDGKNAMIDPETTPLQDGSNVIQEETNMKNEISRRNFLRLSGAVVTVAALSGALTGCGYDKKPVEVQPFNKELIAGDCKVTFLTVGGTKSSNVIQEVTLKVENLGDDAVNLKKTDFTIQTDAGQKLEIASCCGRVKDAPNDWKDSISVAAGQEMEIGLWLMAASQIEVKNVQTVTASVTINGVTVSATDPKEKFKWWYG